MNRSQCLEILHNKSHSNYKEFHHLFFENRWKCRKHYEELGLYKKGYVLHHNIINCDNYEEWKIDEITSMSKSDHSRLHTVVYKQGLGSKESLDKAHKVLSEKYRTGELVPWNKEKRVQVSVRKGKTGAEFPFLCASKKGKPAWNKGKHNPHSEESKLKIRDTMIELTKLGKNDAFLYSCKGTIFINNGIRNKRIKKTEDFQKNG